MGSVSNSGVKAIQESTRDRSCLGGGGGLFV